MSQSSKKNIRRPFKYLICLLMALFMLPLWVCGVRAEDGVVRAGTPVYDEEAGTVTLDVFLDENAGFVVWAIEVEWDYSLMTLIQVDFGLAPDADSKDIEDPETGVFGINEAYAVDFGNVTARRNYTSTGLLFTLTFRVDNDPVDSQIRLTNMEGRWGNNNIEELDMGEVVNSPVTILGETNTVTFITNGDTVLDPVKVSKGKTLTKPADPEKAGNMFMGWYLDDAEYDFSTPVTSDITLTAKWYTVTKVDAVEADCETDGNIEFYYREDGKYFKDESCTSEITLEDTIVKAKGHSLVLVEGKPATCEEEGTADYWKCSVDGKMFSDESGTIEITEADLVLAPLGHEYDDGVVTKEATCEETGIILYTCKHDSSHTKTEEIPAKGHTLEKVEGKAATCTESGILDSWRCAVCDKLFADENGETEVAEADLFVEALGHDFGDWTVVTAATCTEEGSEQRVCSHDESHVETRTIPATGHTLVYVEEKAATCEEDGNIAYWKCSVDGALFLDAEGTTAATETDIIVTKLGHDYGDWTVTKEATCIEEGEETRICSHDSSHVETRSTPTVDHNWGDWTVVTEATEEEEGLEERVCYVCGEKETRVIPTLDHVHVLVKVEAKEAGCEEDGNIEYWICEKDGMMFADEEGTAQYNKEDVVIKATGHDWDEGIVTLGPDCEAVGIRTYTCKNDASHTKTEEIPAIGHEWDEGTITKEPTCEETGEKTYICAYDSTHVKTEELPAIGHEWGEGTVTKDATCEEAGEMTYVCLHDETHIKTEEIPAIGHEWDEGTVTKEATCDEAGEMIYVCLHDETHTKTEPIKAIGHDWGEWVIVKEATEESEGLKRRICANDETHEETEVIPALEKEEVSYIVSSGDNGTWTKGTSETLKVIFKRSTNDTETYSHFVNLSVDGKVLNTSQFKASSGSLVAELNSSFLETLSAGEHKLTAVFDDGSADAAFTVKEKPSVTPAPTPTPTVTPSPTSAPAVVQPVTTTPAAPDNSGRVAVPNTRDDFHGGVWIALLVIGLGITVSALKLMRKYR